METPTVAGGRSRGARGTPGSGRRRSAVKTPKSVLTPNDDAAEKASARRKRRSQALRLSLSDAFAGHADQQASQHGQHTQAGPAGQGSSSSKPMLSEEARNNLLEQCLKLATENKITDRNAWHLDLISHLPDIVGSGPAARAQHSSSSTSFNFQKMSGGLDAGVTIYARRVELTYKSARSLGCYGKQQGDDAEGEDGYENEGGEDDDGLDDAAAAAAKAQAKQKGRGARQGGGSADEEATLTTPDHLRAKKGDATFAVDPLFHTMSALFDEGGAKGLLLLNRSVYSGAHIMTDAQDVPEQQFPLTQTQEQQQQQDVLLDLRPLQTQLTACSSGSASVLTPGLQQLYTLLEETRRALPGYKQQQQPASASGGGVDVAGIMQQALRNLPPNPLPKRLHSAQAGVAGAAADSFAAADADADMADADGAADSFPDASTGAAAADTDMPLDGDSSCSSGAGEGPVSGSLPVVASFLASCEAAAADEAEDAAAADDEGYGGEFDEGHPGYGDEGDSSWGGRQQQEQQQQADRPQSLLGLGGGGQDPDQEGACGLDAEALQQLLGAAAGQQPGTTAGSGWAGSRFWKYRSAAAATTRMAAGGRSSSGGAVKRAAAGMSKGRSSSSSSSSRIDFTCRPADLSAAVAPGDPRKTRLVSAPSAGTADTLLPEDLRYQASSLLQLFLRPSPISFGRQQQQQQGRGSHSTGDGQLSAWDEEGGGAGEDGEGWGGDEYGYSDDGDGFGSGTGAEGYNAGDLSVGDPGFSSVGGAGGVSGSGGSEWWSAEGELLSAPKRMAGGGVKYQRSAKQVDVRALKDLLWDSLVTVNTEQQQAGSNSRSPASSAPQAADSSAAVIPFQDVIVAVPSDSAAGPLEDVSVHMCFICLLHLANEKGLVVRAQEDLKTLTISNVQQ